MVLLVPLVGNFAISWTAAVHASDLKDPPLPASDFLETRNTIKRSSSSGDHWHFVPGSVGFLTVLALGSAAFRPRLVGGNCAEASLVGLLEELRVCIRDDQVRLQRVVIAMVTNNSHHCHIPAARQCRDYDSKFPIFWLPNIL